MAMKDHKKAINRVLSSIDWRKIKSYHAKLGIKWEYEIDKEIVYRVPNIPELKSELSTILEHMAEEKLDYISHGSWVIFWEPDSGDIRVIFRLADFSFEDHSGSRESLEEALKKAVEREDYEYAAVIRDEINNKNNANSNIK
jgi:hypothetical protein